MRTVYRTAFAAAFLAVGYVLGTLQVFDPAELKAQGAAGGESSTSDKIKAAQKAVEEAQQAMVLDKSYQPVIEGLNSFAVTVGGVDALKDLEDGRGVDPETFAGLYAGQVINKYAADIKSDENNRLMYKNKVIRMYSVDRLKKLYARRAEIAGKKKTRP